MGDKPMNTGVQQADGLSQAEPVPVSSVPASIPDATIHNWNATPFQITTYAPSHRQFRLSDDLSEEQITEALGGIHPERIDNGKVTLEWSFFAEKKFHDGHRVRSISTCCKIWDYQGARWSAYGFPEAFLQIGLTPLLVSTYGYVEEGNPLIPILTGAVPLPFTKNPCPTDPTPDQNVNTTNHERTE